MVVEKLYPRSKGKSWKSSTLFGDLCCATRGKRRQIQSMNTEYGINTAMAVTLHLFVALIQINNIVSPKISRVMCNNLLSLLIIMLIILTVYLVIKMIDDALSDQESKKPNAAQSIYKSSHLRNYKYLNYLIILPEQIDWHISELKILNTQSKHMRFSNNTTF